MWKTEKRRYRKYAAENNSDVVPATQFERTKYFTNKTRRKERETFFPSPTDVQILKNKVKLTGEMN
jgi:hypothetical protein